MEPYFEQVFMFMLTDSEEDDGHFSNFILGHIVKVTSIKFGMDLFLCSLLRFCDIVVNLGVWMLWYGVN